MQKKLPPRMGQLTLDLPAFGFSFDYEGLFKSFRERAIEKGITSLQHQVSGRGHDENWGTFTFKVKGFEGYGVQVGTHGRINITLPQGSLDGFPDEISEFLDLLLGIFRDCGCGALPLPPPEEEAEEPESPFKVQVFQRDSPELILEEKLAIYDETCGMLRGYLDGLENRNYDELKRRIWDDLIRQSLIKIAIEGEKNTLSLLLPKKSKGKE